ncbi:hypothetical protein BJY22_005741 [Kribbella shirazensis]|uniref:Uncharacterized protein n=1 Tax=Kribbella shirazensis TaxID=1105143 RepID=A0A7X5VEZ9_9ACTN|nr:hypothetical protein [Kribbella shirazensis]
MRWRQTDATTYQTWIATAGLTVGTNTFVPEGTGGHFWTHRPVCGT